MKVPELLAVCYVLSLVGLSLGLIMLYFGAVRHEPLRLAGRSQPALEPPGLRQMGMIFTTVGALAVIGMASLLISIRSQFDLVPFAFATALVPAVTVGWILLQHKARGP